MHVRSGRDIRRRSAPCQDHYQAKVQARMQVGRPCESYPAAMSTSPVSPEDIRAAAEVHAELGPEYSDAVVAAFIAEVDRQVAARVEARLASTVPTRPAEHGGRWQLFKGMAIGVCAGALAVAGIGLAVPRGSSVGVSHGVRVVPGGLAPGGGSGGGSPLRAQLLPYPVRQPRIATPPRPSS